MYTHRYAYRYTHMYAYVYVYMYTNTCICIPLFVACLIVITSSAVLTLCDVVLVDRKQATDEYGLKLTY
jgi:hypothetical protein